MFFHLHLISVFIPFFLLNIPVDDFTLLSEDAQLVVQFKDVGDVVRDSDVLHLVDFVGIFQELLDLSLNALFGVVAIFA